MKPLPKLFLYLFGVAVVFGIAFVAGRSLVPEDTVANWTREANENSNRHGSMDAAEAHTSHEETYPAGESPATGLSLGQDGYRLGRISAPAAAGSPGEISFQVLGPDGRPVVDYAELHEKRLHLIVVRQDGAEYEHAHPQLDPNTGTWSLPWTWRKAGNYRLFADFQPGTGASPGNLTLSRTLPVAGSYRPETRGLSRTDSVDGFTVSLSGSLKAGQRATLTAGITRNDGGPVQMEPYLGANGHLVVLRGGDLAYLHAHPESGKAKHSTGGADHESSEAGHGAGGDGHETGESDTNDHVHGGSDSPAEVSFEVTPPTPGRYLMYLDFKVDGEVRTARFVLEAGK